MTPVRSSSLSLSFCFTSLFIFDFACATSFHGVFSSPLISFHCSFKLFASPLHLQNTSLSNCHVLGAGSCCPCAMPRNAPIELPGLGCQLFLRRVARKWSLHSPSPNRRHSGSCDFAVDSKSENSRKRRIWRSSSHGGGQLSQCLKKVRV